MKETQSLPSLASRGLKGLVLVGLGALASALLETSTRATEATYVLKSLVFAALELVSSHPLLFGAVNAGVAVLLFSPETRPRMPWREGPRSSSFS